MTRLKQRCVIGGLVLVLVWLIYPLAGCGGGGGDPEGGVVTPNNWDAMLWDTGIWQ